MVSLQIVAHYLECVYAEHMKVTAKTDKVDAFYIGSFTFFFVSQRCRCWTDCQFGELNAISSAMFMLHATQLLQFSNFPQHQQQ